MEAARCAELEVCEHADQLVMQTSLMEQRDAELVEMQVKHDRLILSRDQEVSNVHAKLEAKVSELEAVRI